MTRLLVLMGSGETTPTMVTPHQRIFAAVGDGPAVILDTPYGFQENADELSARTVEYFAQRVGRDVSVASLRDAERAGPVGREVAAATVRDASWVFAGPGSPSYLARQWLATDLPAVLRARLTGGGRDGAFVFASAAACTVGAHTIPVYELYKVGQAPHWQDGLDLLRPLGLDAIVVPHYDNAEGGTHDTSCCYVGDRRLRQLEAQLPATTWILGIDEHTAAVLDLEAATLHVEGRGRVVVRRRDGEHVITSGQRVSFDELRAFAGVESEATGPANTSAPEGESAPGVERAADGTSDGAADDVFEGHVARGDLLGAAARTAELLEPLEPALRDQVLRQIVALARIAQSGLHEHRELVAPHVDTLLRLREQARAERRFPDADTIRDGLVAAGIDVHDGPEGSTWGFTDPLDGALESAAGR